MSYKSEFKSGVFYTAVAKYSGILIQLCITAVLSRLLTPEDFGVVAIATVIIQFFSTISEAGIGPAIIQKKKLTADNISAIFTLTLIGGLFLCLGFYFCSPLIAEYYHNQSLTLVCQWLSILILFSSLDIVTNALLLKQKRFKAISIRTLAIQISTGVLSIYVALHGWGLYALVLSAVLSKVLVFIVNYCCNPLKLNFHMGCLRTIASYSGFQFMFNILNYFSRNADKLIIGKFMGMNQLGYYEKSYRLMMLPLSNITYVFTPVMHPIFSEMQDNKILMFQRYCKILKIIGCLSFPLMAFLFFNAKELILIVFGDQWMESVIPFKILALTTALQVLHATAGGIFQAIDDTKDLFISSLLSAILLISGFIVSSILFDTIVAVAISFLITCTMGSCIVFYFLFKKFNKSIWYLFKVLRTPIVMGCIEFAVLGSVWYMLPPVNEYTALTINTITIVTMTTLFLWKSNNPNLKEIINIIRK